MILLQVEPGLDVGVPGLEVDGETALAPAAALQGQARGRVERRDERQVVDREHGADVGEARERQGLAVVAVRGRPRVGLREVWGGVAVCP